MSSHTLRLTTVAGFDIKIDASWVFIAALIVWTLYGEVFPAALPGQTPAVYMAMAIAGALCFFTSLVLHELAHSLVARRFGLKIAGITLFIFGGVAELTEEPRNARSEFWIAIAGPVMSLILAAAFWVVGTGAQSVPRVAAVCSYLAGINLALALFNMVPAFPLDGGRVFRSVLWWKTGNLQRATATAARAGSLFAWVLVLTGGFDLLIAQDPHGLWLVFVGSFLLMAARSAALDAVTKAELAHRTVANVMTSPAVVISPDLTVQEVTETYMLGHGLSFLPVVRQGDLIGLLDLEAVRALPRSLWAETPVEAAMSPLSADMVARPEMPAYDALRQMATSGRRKMVVASGSKVIGIVTLADLTEYITLSHGLRGSGQP